MSDETMIIWHEWLDSAVNGATSIYSEIKNNGYQSEDDAIKKGGILAPKHYRIRLIVEEVEE